MRDGNAVRPLGQPPGIVVASLPMRDGNLRLPLASLQVGHRCEPTYEGWKRGQANFDTVFCRGCEPTYEGWKRQAHVESLRSTKALRAYL